MPSNSILTAEDALDIYTRAHAGEKQGDIAKDHVISQATVSDIKRGLCWNEVTGHERVRPLTARQDRIREIYAEYWEKKQPVPAIAERFGVSLTTVYNIRGGKTAAGITGHPNPKPRKKASR